KNEKAELQAEIDKLKREQQMAMRQKQLDTRPQQEQQKKNTLNIVVAKRTIESGTRLDREDLEIQEWEPDAVPLNAANYPEALLGRITSDDFVTGEPILPSKLIDKDTKTLSIPDGYRAMTLPITSLTGVGGFITPGARVDLITVVPRSAEGEADEKISKILLQNVKVLATSGNVNDSFSRGKKASGSSEATITVAVPAESAVKLALAYDNGNGNVQVILRGFSDGTKIDKVDIDTAELLTGQMHTEEKDISIPDVDLPPPPSQGGYSEGSNVNLNSILSDVDGLPPPAPPTARTKTHSIEIIQANSRQEVSFETEI
ncbi:MAG: Flp pilus assembly protein CpaB, partial [Vampirovibrionia bacterium]